MLITKLLMIMIKKEYEKLKENLECPCCGSKDIDLYFIDLDCNEKHYLYVHDNYFTSDYGFQCECKGCGESDDYMHFDETTYLEVAKRWHKKTQKKTLNELDKK